MPLPPVSVLEDLIGAIVRGETIDSVEPFTWEVFVDDGFGADNLVIRMYLDPYTVGTRISRLALEDSNSVVDIIRLHVQRMIRELRRDRSPEPQTVLLHPAEWAALQEEVRQTANEELPRWYLPHGQPEPNLQWQRQVDQDDRMMWEMQRLYFEKKSQKEENKIEREKRRTRFQVILENAEAIP